ncbi:complex I NDUFA9 subunit family protein [Sphingosinicella sp. LHD-64]|uniref:complex I NDUFA9 subunit family protein n=1 Tax=Sphingosinicella sp. LHD-64 TaxID=3072139 RepID=UPI00280FBF0C|nr:complex I NDUFA9 subunit family protein [Sphingosinicella sp. LHD-64]MDQ8756767.1 complex I NDUFA9 subunit family protein [Sphingosinicella sp. LHD-64]
MTAKTDRLVTLFGGGGFIGRYVAQALYAEGARVRIAAREPKRAYFLKPLGGLGQTQFVRADITDPASVAAAVTGADAVVNLVGVFKGDLKRVHVDGARNVAEAAAAAGARALVHISAIGADPKSESHYGRTKGEGEAAVKAAFPTATVVRPSIAFGPEDDFVNKFARMAQLMPAIPVLRGSWQVQPLFVADLGKAIAAATSNAGTHGGKIYELAGPQVMTMHQLNEWIVRATGRNRAVFDIPDAIGSMIARLGFLPGAPISWDQWLMLRQDSVASGALPGFEAFGLKPAPLSAVAENWLAIYRRHGRFAAPSAP